MRNQILMNKAVKNVNLDRDSGKYAQPVHDENSFEKYIARDQPKQNRQVVYSRRTPTLESAEQCVINNSKEGLMSTSSYEETEEDCRSVGYATFADYIRQTGSTNRNKLDLKSPG